MAQLLHAWPLATNATPDDLLKSKKKFGKKQLRCQVTKATIEQ